MLRYLQQVGEIAQSVEQRTENPCVGGSIPPLATTYSPYLLNTSKTLFLRAVIIFDKKNY